nr:uncharacterized protein LOC126053516 [Helicoverpa armigera]
MHRQNVLLSIRKFIDNNDIVSVHLGASGCASALPVHKYYLIWKWPVIPRQVRARGIRARVLLVSAPALPPHHRLITDDERIFNVNEMLQEFWITNSSRIWIRAKGLHYLINIIW